MKRIAFLSVFAFVAIGILMWATQSFVTLWEPMLRTELEQRLSAVLQKRVRIDHLALAYLHRLDIKDVEIWETQGHPSAPFFRAKQISLTVSLLDLPHALLNGQPEDSIGLISLDSPVAILSKDLLRSRPSSGRGGHHPLFFAVSWDHATLQWKDPEAPHGAWTLYNASGIFRLRGPKIDLVSEGSLEQASSIQVRFSTWGHKWSGSARLRGCDIAGTAALIRHLANRPLWPEAWKAAGRFSLDAKWGGRLPLNAAAFTKALLEARLSLDNARLEISPQSPPLDWVGGITYRDARLALSDFSLHVGSDIIRITGHVWPFLSAPRLDITAAAQHLNLASLNPYWQKDPTFLQGFADADLSAKGPFANPEIQLLAKSAQGQIRSWPYQNAEVKALYTNNHWELNNASLQIWHGTVALKGYRSKEQIDLQLTASDLALQEAAPNVLTGKANLACAMNGPLSNPRTTGSFWLTNLSWGNPVAESVRGNFDFTDNHFHGEGASDDTQFRVTAEAAKTAEGFSLQDLQLRLRSGGTINTHGNWTAVPEKLRMVVQGRDLELADDIPRLTERFPALRGQIDVDGRIDGTLTHPSAKARVTGEGLHISTYSIPSVDAELRWSPGVVRIPSFHISPGLSGSWQDDADHQGWILQASAAKVPLAPLVLLFSKREIVAGQVSGELTLKNRPHLDGAGDLQLSNGRLGSFPISHAHFGFSLHDHHLAVHPLAAESERLAADFTGSADWTAPPEGSWPDKVVFVLPGKIRSPATAGNLWQAPVQIQGSVYPRDHWRGDLQIKAPALQIRSQVADSLQAHVTWSPQEFHWDGVQWGPHWSSQGVLRFTDGDTQLTGDLQAHQAPLAQAQAWLWPQIKEPIDGALSGKWSLAGSLREPLIGFSGDVIRGQWRAFHFDSHLLGQWKRGAFDPVDVSGKLTTGGTFHFRGRVLTSDGTAAGTLDLSALALGPIGQSLVFPHPLDGTADGTFTVTGPVNALHLAGHLDGTAVSYGEPTHNPIKLAKVVTDMTLEPGEKPGVTRLTLSQAIAKTQEEEIRLAPGSFVEFAGHQPARLQVDSEIRNLHLGLFTLFGGLDLNGIWEIKPRGFALTGDVHTRSLFINDYELQEGHIEASYYDGVISFVPPQHGATMVTGSIDLRAAPQLNFTNFFISGKNHQGLRLTGDVGPTLWDFVMRGQGLDIGTLSGLAGFPYPLLGTANVNIKGHGDLEHPQVEGDVSIADGRALGLDFRSGSATFVWQGNRMTFTKLRLEDPGRYTLSGAGVFPLISKTTSTVAENRDIDFSVRLMDSNLGLLQSLSSEVKQARGSVEALLQIKGTAEAPSLRGSIRIQHGDVVGAHYFKHLRDFHLVADFDGNDLVLSDVGGKSGEGEFKGSGHILYSGFEPRLYDLHLSVTSSKGIDVVVPELAIPGSPLAKKIQFLTTASQAVVKGRVALQGTAEAPVFSGDVALSNGHFTFPPQAKNASSAALLNFTRRLNWDLSLKFSDGAWFENELVEANLNGALHFKGPSDRLRLDGGMDIPEGKISYLGIDFDIQQARFEVRTQEFDSNLVTTPYVRGTALSTVQTLDPVTGQGVDDTITLTIDYAPINAIHPRLVSALDPSLPQDKLFARVAQLELKNLTPQEQNYLYQQQMVRLIDTSLTTPLANSLLKRTGLVDQLRVSRVINPAAASPLDPNQVQASQQQNALNLFAGTKYTLAKNLSNKLSLGYGLRFEQIVQPETFQNKLDLRSDVELSYRMLSNVYLKGSFDLPSSTPGAQTDRRVTIEPRWRFGWWGNTNKPKAPNPTPAPN